MREKLIGMTRFMLLGLFCWCFPWNSSQAQSSFLAQSNVAVFVPAGYDATKHSSSVIFVEELQNKGSVPQNWEIKPVFSIKDGKSVATIAIGQNVDLYGNGEVTGPLRRNNTYTTLWNTDNYIYFSQENGKRLYQSHPWIIGVRKDGTAFGVIADNTWKQKFELTNSITVTSEGPAFRVVVIESANALELGKKLGELTGRMNLPPLWALGFQQCRYSYCPDTQVKDIADQFRTRRIPLDVIWMDIDYMDSFKIFTFDPRTFPKPKELNNYLHSKNVKAVYMIDPGVKKQKGYFVYEQGLAGNHWTFDSNGNEFNGNVWPGACAFPDFTRPETSKWWSGLYANFMPLGVDGVWNDMNEPSVFNGPDGTMPAENLHRGGGEFPQDKHLRYHNIYGMLMVKASREGIMAVNPTKRPFILSRSNFLGGQRYAATWTGDNHSTFKYLKLSIPMSISLSLSGQPFNGPDIGGFDGNANAELLGHWMALGAYYPFSRNHSSKNTVNQEPWAFGEKIEKVCRTAINRRYRLLPYLYTQFFEASLSNTPIMRPVFYADFTDLSLRTEQQAFLLGGDLLIIPRWACNVNLPKGDWDVLKLEDEDDGYQPIVMQRSGSIVPISKIIQSTEEYKTDSITLLVNPKANGEATGTMYDDSGNGYEYKTGEYAILQFNSSKTKDSLKVGIRQMAGERSLKRVFRIGFVSDNSIIYSNWTDKNNIAVKYVEDERNAPDCTAFFSLYVVGKFNNSVAFSPEISYNINGFWESDTLDLTKGKYQLKFATKKDLSGKNWGNASGISAKAVLVSKKEKDISFEVTEDARYIILFNQNSGEYKIEKIVK